MARPSRSRLHIIDLAHPEFDFNSTNTVHCPLIRFRTPTQRRPISLTPSKPKTTVQA